MKATNTAASLSADSVETAVPPGCIALLATNPNGDALIRAIATGAADKGCASSSGHPPNLTTRQNDWLVYSDSASNTSARYRQIDSVGGCLSLIQIRQNFGGTFTSDELLILESGKQEVPESEAVEVLTVLQRFPGAQKDVAQSYLASIAKQRGCGN